MIPPLFPLLRRAHGAQVAVLGLGMLSALALLGASLADFGDPRATARAQAQQLVRAEIAEVRLAWDEVQTRDVPPPGAGTLLRFDSTSPGPFQPVETMREAGRAKPGPLTLAYFDLGHGALERGDAPVALESFMGGLADASAETAGYRGALFGALRAAGTLGQVDQVLRLREELYRLNDTAIEGTSLQLLAALVPPVDPEGAHRRLMLDATALPPPRDGVAIENGEIKIEQDPWWSAPRALLVQAPTASELDWDAAFRTSERLQVAVEIALREAAFAPTERWTIARVPQGWLIARDIDDAVEVASLRPTAFAAGLIGDAEDELLRIDVGTSESAQSELAQSDATPLPGTPFSVSATHLDPEGAATVELRRMRILRYALFGLGLLVLLATALSARAMARARQLNELRSTFVASVSHDLRTPTQAILLLAETLEQDLVEAPEGRARYHTQIRKEAQRLRRLVEDLLDGARIDRGDGARIERRDVESAGFFGELQGAMEERAKGAGAQLEMEVAKLPGVLQVDPDGLYRAVWNLFENALRYGRHGESPADVSVTVRAQGESLEVAVADRGPGIPPQHAQSIFRPFQRLLDRGPKSEIQSDTGTGLGLAIVRAICRAHGGSVELQPRGAGARFVLVLPIKAPEGEAP